MSINIRFRYSISGIVFPFMLGLMIVLSVVSVSAMKLATHESNIVHNSQSYILTDHSAQNGIQLLLRSVKEYPECFHWQVLLNEKDPSDFLRKEGASCRKLAAAIEMKLSEANVSVATLTRYCGAKIAPGYEINTFMEQEFQTLANAELVKPLTRSMTNVQGWSRLDLFYVSLNSGDSCE